MTSAVVSCEAWWDETSCVLAVADGLTPGASYDVVVEAVIELDGLEYFGTPAQIDFDTTDNALPPPNVEPDPVIVTLGSAIQPLETTAVATPRVPDAILDFSTVGAGTVTVDVAGYVSVPQGHVQLDAAVPAGKSVAMTGGLVAGTVRADSGVLPDSLSVIFDNPTAQKRVKIRSVSTDDYRAVSETVVQINRSGSVGINSWIVQ